MRILIVSQHFWPESFRINDLVAALDREGAQLHVLTGQPNYPEGKIYPGYKWWRTRRERYGHANVVRVPLIPRSGGGAFRLAANYLSFIFSAGVLAPLLLRRQNYDAILVYATSPLLQALTAIPLKYLKGVPLIVWVQDLWPESLSATGYVKNRLVLKFVEMIVRFVYRHADLILVQSESFRNPVGRLAEGREIQYFPNPAEAIDLESARSYFPIFEQIPLDCFSIVFAGNLGAAQGLDTVLDAAELLVENPGICIFLVGDGSRAAWVREEITRRGLSNVKMLGRHPSKAMPALYERASSLLVCLSDEPAFALTVPSKVQTYLAAGRPIIGCLNGEGARIIQDAGAGVVSPAGDAKSLANAVRHVASLSQRERIAMGDAGRRYHAAHFELETLAKKLIGSVERMTRPAA